MNLSKFSFLLICCAIWLPVIAQPSVYTAANAHSHNDYRQYHPFSAAYNEQFGSMEVDIHLSNGRLLVGHDTADLTSHRTLESMYLVPLSNYIKNNAGYVYKDRRKKLQLLIDIKTDSIQTLKDLLEVLKK